MKLKESRKKISKALDTIVEKFKEIESTLTPFQKRWGARGLERDNRLNYFPVKGYEGITTEYTDREGNTFEIKIFYKNRK